MGLRRTSLVFLALALSCGVPNEPLDGGVDGGADSGRDASADARRDAARDSGRDVGLDSGPDDPGWEPMESFPEECRLESALYPERIEIGAWTACEGASCLRLDTVGRVVAVTREIDGELAFFMMFVSGSAQRLILVRGGSTIGAWQTSLRPPAACGFAGITLGMGRASFAVDYLDSGMGLAWNRVLLDTIESIADVDAAALVLDGEFLSAARFLSHAWLTDTLYVFQTSPDGALYSWDGIEYAALTRPWPGLPQGVGIAGEHVVFGAYGDSVRLAAVRPGEPWAYFRDVTPRDAFYFYTDGIDLAWLEATPDAGAWRDIELMTMRYDPDLGGASPRRVRAMSAWTPARVGGGYYALRRNTPLPQRVEVYSLADGTRRDFVPPGEPPVLEEPVFLDDREMIVRTPTGYFRVDPSELPIVVE